MADFKVLPGRFSIQVNDGHSAEVYEIDAESVEDAMAKAEYLWSQRMVPEEHEDREPPKPKPHEPHHSSRHSRSR